MIDRSHELPVTRRAKALGISRGSVYCLPRPASMVELEVMWRIDALHLEYPFARSRMLRDMLRQEGFVIGRLRVASLMKKMAIDAIYRRPNTAKPTPGHKVYTQASRLELPPTSIMAARRKAASQPQSQIITGNRARKTAPISERDEDLWNEF